jgi:hypothetical protein
MINVDSFYFFFLNISAVAYENKWAKVGVYWNCIKKIKAHRQLETSGGGCCFWVKLRHAFYGDKFIVLVFDWIFDECAELEITRLFKMKW